MIRTKDLLRFLNDSTVWFVKDDVQRKYRAEIIKRLQTYDELKEGIKKLSATLTKEA